MKLDMKLDLNIGALKGLHHDTRLLVVKLLLGLAGLLVCCLVFLLPQWASVGKLDAKIAAAEERKQQLAAFLPSFARLNKLVEQGQGLDLPVPAGKPLEMAELDGLPDRLSRMGADSGLEPLDVVISPSSLREGTDRIMLQCVLAGKVDGFERFWRQLNALPCLDRVDRVEVQAVPGGLEFFVELWVILKKA